MATQNDEYFGWQWHLVNDASGELDLNVAAAWDDYTGKGVRVAVIDDGFDIDHPDLAPNYDTASDRDYKDGVVNNRLQWTDFDASWEGDEYHGTAVMGLIGASAEGDYGTVGVAHEATLIGYRSSGFADRAFRDASTSNSADIVNQSQGATEAFDIRGTGGVTVAIAEGRDFDGDGKGLGTVIVKSAGNSRADFGDDDRRESNAEAIDATFGTVSVAAINQDGFVSNYSSPGANLLVSAFGSPSTVDSVGSWFEDVFTAGVADVVTTDIVGEAGYADGDVTETFNGTSSSAPMVSGVVALMLEANPGLGWRDVQSILAASARHVGSEIGEEADGYEEATAGNASWFWNDAGNWNGGGMHFSNDYGFGLVDAKAAVRLAETWTTTSTSENLDTATIDILTDADATLRGAYRTTADLDAPNGEITIEYVELELDFHADDTGAMEVYLTSPDGTTARMIGGSGGGTTFGTSTATEDWTFGANAFRGEGSDGEWKVEIEPNGSAFTLDDIRLTVHGDDDADRDDVFIFTNEFSDYAGRDGHSTRIEGNGGDNTLNAAAVDAASVISLLGNHGLIDGRHVTVLEIDRVYTGDGDDFIQGDSHSDHLASGRGDDTIYGGGEGELIEGGAGTDSLHGGGGDDTIDGGWGNDRLDGGAGTDTLDVSYYGGGYELDMASGTTRWAGETAKNFENVVLGSGDDTISGSGDANHIEGGRGHDSLAGGGGNDTIEGGAGHDTIDGGWGYNQMDGGAGTDTLDVSYYGGGYTLNLGTGVTRWDGETATDFEAVITGSGADRITGDGRSESAVTNGGNDVIDLGWGHDTIDAGNGNDTVQGGRGRDVMDGGDGFDKLVTTEFNGTYQVDLGTGETNWAGETAVNFEAVETGNGNDRIIGTGKAEVAVTNGGHDVIDLGWGNDIIASGAGDDTVQGGRGRDEMDGGDGYDKLLTTEFNGTYEVDLGTGETNWAGEFAVNFEAVETGNGDDRIVGNDADNLIQTNGGSDDLFGMAGDDTLEGGAGRDYLAGGADDDVLRGGQGNDFLVGGAGADRFEFSTPGLGDDWIEDFTDGIDLIDFSGNWMVGDFSQLTITSDLRMSTIHYGRDSIDLFGVAENELDANDFIFA